MKRLSVKVSHDQRIIELMFGFTSGYPEELKSIHLTTGDLINCTKTTVRNVLKIALIIQIIMILVISSSHVDLLQEYDCSLRFS